MIKQIRKEMVAVMEKIKTMIKTKKIFLNLYLVLLLKNLMMKKTYRIKLTQVEIAIEIIVKQIKSSLCQ